MNRKPTNALTSAELQRVKAIFSEAAEFAGAERDAFVEQACENDLELRVQVRAYLQAADAAGDLLDSPGGPLSGPERPGHRAQQVLGSTIDQYKLVELIGEGGFGSVFMAEQQEPVQRQVALKIIKLGMDTQRVIARFELERQALAIMDHPNIARVYDAGATATGRPYFVMELVRGVPITEYCDTQRLNTNQRLELFIIVCNAIQHAHNKSVIHRDIKPSNVLVTFHDAAAVPKVIDFGIAKATDSGLTETTALTDARQFVGTPAYMSPEQAGISGLDIDTRSDIYSLGVLLYELLAGTTPFDPEQLRSATLADVQRIIREVDPPSPSTRLSTLGQRVEQVAAMRNAAPHKLRQLLRGELDWIVMKAIEKDRSRRYETANELARDIRRHLSNQPIEACPPSVSYRLRKFVRRNRSAVLTTLAFVATLVIAGGTYVHGIRSEQLKTSAALLDSQQQRAQADQRRAEAQQATSRALTAETQANEQLVLAAITQAHGARAGTHSGRQFDSLRLLAAAAKISPNAEVRSQAIACMGAADMRIAQQWSGGDHGVTFDHACAHFADCAAGGEIVVRRVPDEANPDGAVVARLPGHAWIYPRHSGNAARVKFSPDDHEIAAAFDDAHVRVFNLDGRVVFDMPGGPAFDFTPDGANIAIRISDGSITTYNVKTGDKAIRLPWPPTDYVSFSPDGQKIAMWNVSPDIDVCVGTIATGYIKRLTHRAPIRAVAWHPSGQVLATAIESRAVQLWDLGDTEPRLMTMLAGHIAPVVAVQFSHGGDLLASASEDGTVRIWDPVTNEEQVHAFCTGALSFTADDRTMAVAGADGTHTLVDVAAGRVRRSLAAPSENRQRVAFSSDGFLVACEGGRSVRFWNLTDSNVNESFSDLKFPSIVRSVAFNPLGNCVIVGTDGGLSRISIREPQKAGAPDANSTRDIRIGGPFLLLVARRATDDGMSEMSRDGQQVAFAQNGQNAMIVDLNHPAKPLTLAPSADTSFISISPDARWVATGTLKGSGDRRVKIWDAHTGKLERSLPIPFDANVEFSPDNRWLVTATAEEIRFWDLETWLPRQGRLVKSSLAGHIFFSPDSRIIALSSQQLGVRLVDVETVADLATLEDEGDERPLGFSPDGSLLATKARNSTIRLWNLRLVREQLVNIGLDWAEPPLPPERVHRRISLITSQPVD